MSLSTHVLDAVAGTPAVAVAVTLTDAGGAVLASGRTDDDGRITSLGGQLGEGQYRIGFDTGGYFAAVGIATFYPEVTVAFEITDAAAHYHVPPLLSPYSYSTYRGRPAKRGRHQRHSRDRRQHSRRPAHAAELTRRPRT
jgi:5-hydroxyisourate hydrolase